MSRENFGKVVQFIRKRPSQPSEMKTQTRFAAFIENLRKSKFSRLVSQEITSNVVGDIEQGKKQLTPELISLFIEAFSIPEHLKHNLYEAAGFHYDPQLPLNETSFQDFLTKTHLPVIVFNPVWDIKAMNSFYIELHSMEYLQHQETPPNLLEHIFMSPRDDPMREMEDWQAKAIWMFHTTALRYAYTKRYQEILQSLLNNSDFALGYSVSLKRDFPEKNFWYPIHQVKYQSKKYQFMALRMPNQYFGNYALAIYVPLQTSWNDYMNYSKTVDNTKVQLFDPPHLE